MKKSYRFIITDVFCEDRYSGNQLLTVFDAADIPSETMQAIASEINFSETTFILSHSQRDGGYDVRIFTPARELQFAGHPTLGTAHLIREFILQGSEDKVHLNLKVGQIPVAFDKEQNISWMQQIQPEFGDDLSAEDLAPVLGLSSNELDNNWPISQVSTGMPFIIVPIPDLKTLKKCIIDIKAYHQLITRTWSKDILVFAPEGYTNTQSLAVRVFPVYEGIMEDPATGSGNGCLAAYLVKESYFGDSLIDITVGQGYEINRPSTLYLKAAKNEEDYTIQIGGKVQIVAEGTWHI